MKRFREIFSNGSYHGPLEESSSTVTLEDGHSLHLLFNSKDFIVKARYEGKIDPWWGSLCYLLEGSTLEEALHFSWKDWEESFAQDQLFWDLRQEQLTNFFFYPLEALRSALDLYRGKEYLYRPSSSLICRCFGVREKDVLDCLRSEENLTLEVLAEKTKAGMGCRSCTPQISRWLAISQTPSHKRFHKERSLAEWALDIDSALNRFPHKYEWKLEVESLKGNQVIISFDREAQQDEEERLSIELQRFLGVEVDGDFGFFLRRARHFSKA
jgi:bacterioferritin-associated ferredoxin